VELAWRLDASGRYGPPRRWMVVTGTNGKTTTTSMLHAMLTAAGRRSVLCGNIGSPVLDVLAEPAELLAVELSSFQLYWSSSLRPEVDRVLLGERSQQVVRADLVALVRRIGDPMRKEQDLAHPRYRATGGPRTCVRRSGRRRHRSIALPNLGLVGLRFGISVRFTR